MGQDFVMLSLTPLVIGICAAVACAPSSSIVRAAWVAMIRFSWARSLIKARTAALGAPWRARALAASMRTAGDGSVSFARRSFLVSSRRAIRCARPMAPQ